MILYHGLAAIAANNNMATVPPNQNTSTSSNDIRGEPFAPSSTASSTSNTNNSNNSSQMILCWQQQNPEDAQRCTVPSSGQPAILQQAVINANNYFGILPHPFPSSTTAASVMSTSSSSSLPKSAPSYTSSSSSGVSLQQHAPAIATSNMYQAVTAGSDPYGSMAQFHNTSGPSLSSQSKGFQAPAPASFSNPNVDMMMMMSTSANNNNHNHTQQQQQQQQPQNAMEATSKNQPHSFSLPFEFDSATTNNLLHMSLQDPNMFANLLLWKALQDANNGVNAHQQQQVQQQQQPQHEQQQVPQQQIQQAQQPQQQHTQRQQQVQPQNQQQLQQQQHLQQLQLQQQQIQQQLLQSYALATGSQATQQQPQAAMTQTTPQVHQSQLSSYQTSEGTNSAVPSLSSSHAFHPYGVGSSTSSSQATPFQTLSSNHQQAMAPAPAAVTANTTTSHQHTDLQGTSNTHNKKLFALQTFVKPVSRDGNNDSPLNDDLWRLFTGDYDDEDDGDSPEETPSSEPIKPAYSTPTLAPLVPMGNAATTTLSAMANPSTVEAPVTLEPIVSAPSWLQPQQQQQQQPQQQPLHNHQQQQQPTPTLSSASSSPAVPPLSSKPFLSTAQQEAAADRQYMMVPPTLFPPTLLGSNTHPSRNSDTASGSFQQSRNKAAAAKAAGTKVKAAGGGRYRKDGGKGSSTTVTPYEHLKTILAERGFTIPKTKSSEAGYVTTPSPLQLASFGTKLVKAVHASDAPLLSSLLECGLSPNPCNQFRDSILDLVCKRANEPIFQCLLDHNADLQVCDGFGRTPLHHAAWASTFSSVIVHAILKRDPSQAFLEDNRGQTPLEYVRPSLVSQWIAFLDEHKDEFWPMGGDANMVTSNPPKRRDLQLADPPNALSVDLAGLVSSGVVEPVQVAAMDELTRRTYQMDQFQ